MFKVIFIVSAIFVSGCAENSRVVPPIAKNVDDVQPVGNLNHSTGNLNGGSRPKTSYFNHGLGQFMLIDDGQRCQYSLGKDAQIVFDINGSFPIFNSRNFKVINGARIIDARNGVLFMDSVEIRGPIKRVTATESGFDLE